MKRKEPINNWKLWFLLIILYILCVPWYLPKGSYIPIIWGVPYCALIIMGISLLVSITLTYIVVFHWHIADDEHEESDD